MTLKKVIVALVSVVAASYVLATFLLVARQRSYIYRPGALTSASPADYGVAFLDVRIPNGANEALAAWWLAHADGKDRPTLVYCHGNSANLSLLAEVAALFYGFGWNALLFDYSGYGNSSTAPKGFSEEQLLADAQSAYEWVKAKTSENKILIWGHSLGSAVAARLAQQNSPAGLILEGSFPSLLRIARSRYPWAPIFPFMIFDRFETGRYVANRSFPLLVMHAENDHITPINFGREVFEQAAPPKRWLSIPFIGHKDFPSVAPKYRSFFSELGAGWIKAGER